MRITMAPMRGFTDSVYRNAWAHHFRGIDDCMAPFVATQQEELISPKLLRDLLPESNRALPVIPQALGNNPRAFLTLAHRLQEMGYTELNWNLGCPYKMVAKKCKGSGLLCHPDRVDRFLDAVMPSAPVKISVKVRLGRHDVAESGPLLAVLNQYPLSEVIFHPRLGVQMYEGRPDLKAFAGCLRACRHPVVYNGDIWSAEDFTAILQRFPALENWMLGRGLLADPFLAETLRGAEIGQEERNDRFQAFYGELAAGYRERLSGSSHMLARMKGWWDCFRLSFTEGDRFFKKIRKQQNLTRFEEEVRAFFADSPAWRIPDPAGWVALLPKEPES